MSKVSPNAANFKADEFNINEAVSGVILHAQIRGAPDSLLLPIRPPYIDQRPDKETYGQMIGGKTPCGFLRGDWFPLEGWEKGNVNSGTVAEADKEGANAGLVLGVPADPDTATNVQAIDIDLDEGCAAHRDAFLTALRPHAGDDRMIWRETWPYRGLVLLNVAGMDAGRKHAWRVTHNGTGIGKIELLSTGQQCVIAGRHASGRWIKWHALAAPQKQFRAPPLNDYALATYPDFPAVLDMLDGVWQGLRGQGYELALISAGAAGNGDAPSADDLAPPDLKPKDIADAFDRMDNPASVDRDRFMNIMWGAAGALRGIQAQHGTTDADESMVARSAALWAARWQGVDPGTYDTELEKWKSDWRVNVDSRGWRHFVADTAGLGIDLATEYAQKIFDGEERPVGDDKPAIDLDRIADKPRTRRHFLSLSALRLLPPTEWLVDGLIEEETMAAAYGLPACGKSFVMQSLGLHIAAGLPWFGMAVKQGAVIYIAGEGAGGVKRRIEAMQASYGIGDEVPFWMLPTAVNFANPEDMKSLVSEIRELAAGIPVRMVIFDTLFWMANGLDLNAPGGMGVAIQAMRVVREGLKCTTVAVHHEGKDKTKGMLGSINLLGTMDTVVHFERDEKTNLISVRPTKQKDGDPDLVLRFGMDKVMVSDGRTTLVPKLVTAEPEDGEQEEDATADKGLSPTNQMALMALQEALDEYGQEIKRKVNGHDGMVKAVKLDQWRDLFFEKVVCREGEEAKKAMDRKRKAFERATIKLQTDKLIKVSNSRVYLIEPVEIDFRCIESTEND